MFLSIIFIIVCIALLGISITVTTMFLGFIILISHICKVKEHDGQKIFEYLLITSTVLLILFVDLLLLKGIILTVEYCTHFINSHYTITY